MSSDDLIAAHEADPAHPDNYDWPSVCFTDQAKELSCNANQNVSAALFVEVEHTEHFGRRVSVGVISSIITLVAFVGLIIAISMYWSGDKDAITNEYALDDINVVRSYSTFQSK